MALGKRCCHKPAITPARIYKTVRFAGVRTMRILDVDSDRAITNVCIYLTPSEAKEMLETLSSWSTRRRLTIFT